MGVQRERRDVVKSYENEQKDETDLNGVQNESEIEFGEFLILIQEQHNRKKRFLCVEKESHKGEFRRLAVKNYFVVCPTHIRDAPDSDSRSDEQPE